MSGICAAVSHMKNRTLIHAKEHKKKNKISSAKQNPATLEGDRALAFSMRTPPKFNGLTSSGSSKQLS